MASDRQHAANRANASKSTGPKTAAGKRRAAGNARRHGLTAPPERAEVLCWYRIITGDPDAGFPVFPDSEAERAALHLAEAESQVARTRRAEREDLENMADVSMKRGQRTPVDLAAVGADNGLGYEEVLDLMIGDSSDDSALVDALRKLKSQDPNRPAELFRRIGALSGYRRRAEGHRRRAFAAWLQVVAES